MRPSRHALVVATASILVVLAFVVAIRVTRAPAVWYGVGAVYSLTLLLAGGVWYWRGRPLEFSMTVGIAAVVVVALLPLTPRLFVFGNPSLRSSRGGRWSRSISGASSP